MWDLATLKKLNEEFEKELLTETEADFEDVKLTDTRGKD